MTTVRRASRVACALALCAVTSEAATPPPDPALLEFLGEWDDGAGGVVDWEMLDAQTPPNPAPDPREEADDAAP